MYFKKMQDLVDFFERLPGIGGKTAERLAFSVLEFSVEELEEMAIVFLNIKDIKKCNICNNFSEEEKCNICLNKERDNGILCVVENVKNLMLFEKSNIFKGKYHVLEKLISPSNAIGPEDLNLNKLIERIDNEKIKEVIIALKSTIEGETTSLYIHKILENKEIIITRLAQGVPLGTDMEYLDSVTLETALLNRKKIVE